MACGEHTHTVPKPMPDVAIATASLCYPIDARSVPCAYILGFLAHTQLMWHVLGTAAAAVAAATEALR